MARLGTLSRLRAPQPLEDATRRAARWSSTPNGLAALFASGLIIRLWLARGGGFPFDMTTFGAWSGRLATRGIHGFYDDPSYFVDYPPGYLYILYVLGRLARLFGSGAPPVFLLKLPGIAADLGLAAVAVRLAGRLAPETAGRRIDPRGAAAAAILLNPAIFFISAVWGQVDAILALLVISSFALLATGEPALRREAGGVALLATALVTKPQAAFVVPVAVLLLVWRHVRGAGVHTASVLRGLGRVAGLGLMGLATGLALMAPFGLGLSGWLRFYSRAAGTYPFTSVWAFNLWGALAFWRSDVSGNDVLRIVGLPALVVGLVLFAVLGCAVLVLVWRDLQRGQLEGRVVVFGAVAMTCVPFAVLTRIHERYLFLAVASLAPLAAWPAMRRALAVLSALYLTNVYFAYVYYVEYVHRDAVKIDSVFRAVYGVGINTTERRIASGVTAAACIFVALRGWTWMRSGRGTLAEAPAADPVEPVPTDAAPRRWALELHPAGRRGAAMAGIAFVLVLVTRVLGLGSAPGMYFDEVYHARTAGEYLQHKEVYEWTHPPLAKELIAAGIATLSGFGVLEGSRAPSGLRSGVAAPATDGIVWASTSGSAQGTVRWGRFTERCGVAPTGNDVKVELIPTAVAGAGAVTLVGGTGRAGPALARVTGTAQLWIAQLPATPAGIVALGTTAFVTTTSRTLLRVSSSGEVSTVADRVGAVAAATEDGLVWATFPDDGKVVSYGDDGVARTTVAVQGSAGPLIAMTDADRVMVADLDRPSIESIDTEAATRNDAIPGPSPRLFASIPQSGLVWAAAGTDVRILEPRGASTLGRVRLARRPSALVPDVTHRRVVALSPGGIECAVGRPQFAWRLGSAVSGAAIAALSLLLVLRLLGSGLAAGLAALFVAVDGIAFTLSRIAMNDSYATAFILALWFCVLSAMRAGRLRARRAAWGWLLLGGLAAGGAVSTKWIGLYALAAACAVVAADVLIRGRAGIGGIAGPAPVSAAVTVLALVGLPAAVYLLSYVPYLRLGHDLTDLVGLQKGMWSYHAHLSATHPYGSPWYMWPIGRKAVWLYLSSRGSQRAEIWTAGNPVVLFGGLAGLATLAWTAVRRRSTALLIVPLMALAQYMPWTLITRVTFLYHYLPEIPMLAIGLAWLLTRSSTQAPAWRRGIVVGAGVAAAVVAFVLLLPITSGWLMSPGYLDAVKGTWLRWMF